MSRSLRLRPVGQTTPDGNGGDSDDIRSADSSRWTSTIGSITRRYLVFSVEARRLGIPSDRRRLVVDEQRRDAFGHDIGTHIVW